MQTREVKLYAASRRPIGWRVRTAFAAGACLVAGASAGGGGTAPARGGRALFL